MPNTTLAIFIAVAVFISLTVSVFEVAFILNRRKKRENDLLSGVSQPAATEQQSRNRSVVVWVFLMVLGLLFAGIGIAALLFSKAHTKGWEEVPAVISSYDYDSSSEDFDVEVSYHFRGKSYEGISLNYGSTSMSEGQVITILVNPRHPESISMNLKTVSGLFYIFIGVGSVFLLLGLFFTIKTLCGGSKERIPG